MADYPSMPDYPSVAGHPAEAGYQAAPGYSAAPGTPAIAHDEYGEDQYEPPPVQYAEEHHELAPARDSAEHHGLAPAGDGEDHYGLAPAGDGEDHYGLAPDEYGVVYDEYGQVHQPAAGELSEPYPLPADLDPGPATALRSGSSAARMAMLAYLTVPLFGCVVPLVVYLRARRGPGWTRAHAAQALNVWITVVLYSLSAAIMGTMLALDSPQIALIVFGPLVVGLWLATIVLLVRAATAASQGEQYTFPGWLCSPIVR
jgi:uncharacterized Tic20 family protein